MNTWQLFIFFGMVLSIGLMACRDGKNKTGTSEQQELEAVFLEKGAVVTAATFQNMSANLQLALAAGGVPSAIDFCNSKVDSLMMNLAKKHQVDIGRTSDKIRNPANAATPTEMKILRRYQSNLSENELPEPMVEVAENKVHYYAPIILMENCLKCHGRKDEDIGDKEYTIIKEYYPDDQAFGFKVGELRGIWSLEFDRP